MKPISLLLRFFCLATLTIWVGGLAFSEGAIFPILRNALDESDVLFVAQQVTDSLNVVGAAALAIWWLTASVENDGSPFWARRVRLWLLVITTTLLIVLVILHRLMEFPLEAGDYQNLYKLVWVYLFGSAIQWLVNLGLIMVSVVLWRDIPDDSAAEEVSSSFMEAVIHEAGYR
jgi:hypothetical protein